MELLASAAISTLQGVLTLVIPLAVLGYLWVRPYHVDRSVPGPRRYPFMGVTFSETVDLMDGVVFDWAHWPTLSIAFSRQFGFRTWGGPTLNIGFGGAFFNIVSPRCLEYILRDNFENYVKGKLSRSFEELMGEFSFTTDGSLWKFHRKVTVGLLNRQTVQHGAKVLHDKLRQLEQILNEKNGQMFDFQKMAYSLTMDVFGKIGFGLDFDGLGNDRHAPFVEALDELNYLMHLRFNDLLWEIKQRLGIGKREQRVRILTKVINEFAEEVIGAIKEKQVDEATTTDTIVSRYLASCQKQNLPPPSNQELRNLVIGFIFAGRDSTSVAMAWTLYEMTRNPTVVNKIRAEVKQATNAGQEPLSYELVQNMPYLHSVVMESLRLHPSAPESFRFCRHDDVLPDGTKIPAGSLVMFSINTINHSEQVWDDPEEFRPERYEGHEPSSFRFPTFSGGPRTCPGKSLALMELAHNFGCWCWFRLACNFW